MNAPSLSLPFNSCRLLLPPVSKGEAEQRGQKWFDESFTKCSGDYFAKYPACFNKEEDQRQKLPSLTEL